MEEVGAQVATSLYVHRPLPGQFCESRSMGNKKRDLCPNYQNPRGIWNPKVWDWDSGGFTAKQLEPDILRLGTAATASSSERGKQDDEAENDKLHLQLGGSLSPQEQPDSMPSKRVRLGSPGAHTYPMCQVDHCREDLSISKDYHRRHKVCEVHSKSTQALVANQMQRFCQQCSRFHLLSEFDEGKRSCRRRLAGHNRRRRKTQPDDITSRLSLAANHGNSASENLDIVSLLAALARAQGNAKFSPTPHEERLVQILGKIKSLPLAADFMEKLPISGSFGQKQAFSELRNGLNGNSSPSSTMDLLPVLSASLAASSADALATVSQNSQSSDSRKIDMPCTSHSPGLNSQERSTLELPPVQRERSNTGFQHIVDDADCQVQGIQPNLPLQLFSSSPGDSNVPKLALDRKYFSSDSSNPMDDRSPPSSPPVAQILFPMQSLKEATKHEKILTDRGANENGGSIQIPLQLFGQTNRGVDTHPYQSFPHHAGYTSSSGSDYSPSSLNSDAQDRTGRIIFKLFDKNPRHLPGPLRTQIYKWLSHSPSEMESYIRPGCIVLSVYVSMPPAAWEKLKENLLEHVNCLVQDSDSDFWRNGRFLIKTGMQSVSYKDGKVRVCKSCRSWKMPEIISVTPLAIVSGQETSLILKGRNLTTPGTNIHYTDMGGYKSKEVSELACQRSLYDEINVSFHIQNEAPCVLGRCFIEVENGLKGNSFPVIIADPTICQELRPLESMLDEEAAVCNKHLEEQAIDFRRPRLREEVIHFLNELGWLFQRKRLKGRFNGADYVPTRFKFLLTFSVQKDCCALVKMLLDMLVETNLSGGELSREPLEMLSEIHLLNWAVKRRCKNMVTLLVHYSVRSSNDAVEKYLFPPNYAGTSGFSPLHLAASMSASDDIIDVLTSDPQEIGVHCWNSLLGANGLTPYAHALMRDNHSYNVLVAQKLADRTFGQVSVLIGNETVRQLKPRLETCGKCAMLGVRFHNRRRISGSLGGLPRRPYIHFMLAVAAVCACVCIFFRNTKTQVVWGNMASYVM